MKEKYEIIPKVRGSEMYYVYCKKNKKGFLYICNMLPNCDYGNNTDVNTLIELSLPTVDDHYLWWQHDMDIANLVPDISHVKLMQQIAFKLRKRRNVR